MPGGEPITVKASYAPTHRGTRTAAGGADTVAETAALLGIDVLRADQHRQGIDHQPLWAKPDLGNLAQQDIGVDVSARRQHAEHVGEERRCRQLAQHAPLASGIGEGRVSRIGATDPDHSGRVGLKCPVVGDLALALRSELAADDYAGWHIAMLRLRTDRRSGRLARMKDQYVGDQNDYAKYQLLRICAGIFEEILVAWMLTAPDERTDGARIGYLKRAEWRRADPELFDGLAALVARGERRVAAVEAAELLPGCSFEADPVPLTLAERGPYFEAIAARATYDSLVFFDPDNGLEV